MSVPFRDCPWTLGRTLGLVALLAMTPALLFALGFVHFEIYPGISPVPPAAELGLALERVDAVGPQGEHVAAWYLPPPRAAMAPRAPVVVILHGLCGNRAMAVTEMKYLTQLGYGVATVDQRHHGDTDALPVTFGLEEAGEVTAVVDRLVARPDVDADRIGVMGFSMGAVTALRVACVDARIRCVIADSPFVSLEEEAHHRIGLLTGPLEPYFYGPTLLLARWVIGHAPAEYEVRSWLPRLGDRPLFLTVGESDTTVSATAAPRIQAARPANTELWTVPGAGHVGARITHAAEYQRRVTAFLGRTLRARSLAGTAP